MNWIETSKALVPYVRRGDLSYCIQHVSDIIRSKPRTPFHDVLDLTFTTPPESVAWHFDRYFRGGDLGRGGAQMAAIYTEMNEFDVNPDRWYAGLFGFWTYGGLDNLDWLDETVDMYNRDIWLLGMEPIQDHHRAHKEKSRSDEAVDSLMDDVAGYCDLLIVLRFQELIQRSAAYMKAVSIPILATAHDYGIIYEITPNARDQG